MKLDVIITNKLNANENMRLDEAFLASLSENPRCILHFYNWEKESATFGYFTDPTKFLKPSHGLDIARRPTGGGIIFHHCDLAFAVLVPKVHPKFSLNTLENYAWINETLMRALNPLIKGSASLLKRELIPLDGSCRHFCMAKPTISDIVVEGRKVGGGAQRRTRNGFLHQGTLALSLPSEQFLERVLLPRTAVAKAILQNSYPLLLDKSDLQERIISTFQAAQFHK